MWIGYTKFYQGAKSQIPVKHIETTNKNIKELTF